MATDNWISVEERLPDDGQSIIFYTTGYSTNEMRMGTFHLKDQWGRPNMFIGDGFFYEKSISHWMPTPKPPKQL